MVLSSGTKENIKDVMLSYKTDIMDKNFYQKIISLINQDDSFLGTINYEFISKSREWAYVEMLKKIMYINPDNMVKYVYEMTKNYENELSKEEIFELRKMFYLFSILHETTHIEQGLMMDGVYDEYEELNRLYYNIFTKLNESKNLLVKILYYFIASKFSFERSANINAYRELFDVYEETCIQPFIVSNYICEVLNGYKETKSGIISPVEDTMKKIGIKYDIQHDLIPFDIAIETGLPVDIIRYNEILDYIGESCLGDVNFKELRKIMSR